MRPIAIFILILLCAPLAYAQNGTVLDFQARAREIPTRLLRLGYTHFGSLDLRDLLNSMPAVSVTSKPKIQRPEPIAGLNTARSSAQWFEDKRGLHIEVSSERWATTPIDSREVIGLHEYLGAAKFRDKNYGPSSALWLLSQPQTQQHLSAAEKQSLVDKVIIEAGGGISGVGGGGEEAGVTTKLMLLKRDLNVLSQSFDARTRQVALQRLHADLDMINEVRWNAQNKKDIDVQVTPSERAEEVQLLKMCAALLTANPDVQRLTFQYVIERQPEARFKVPTVEALLNFCRSTVTGRP